MNRGQEARIRGRELEALNHLGEAVALARSIINNQQGKKTNHQYITRAANKFKTSLESSFEESLLPRWILLYHLKSMSMMFNSKGRVTLPNRMNFRKSSKRPLTPPLIFGKLYCAFCDKIVTEVRMFIWRNFCVFYDPISHAMHVAQIFNMVIG